MSNISSEFKEIITIISNSTMKPIEKMNQLVHLQEMDNIKYNLKQIFKTKDIIRSSASLASFIMDKELFFLLEEKDLISFKNIKCAKNNENSMSVIIPLLINDKEIDLTKKQLLLKKWISNDSIDWKNPYTEGFLENYGKNINIILNAGRRIKLGKRDNILSMLNFINDYETIIHIKNNFYNEETKKLFFILKEGKNSNILRNAFLELKNGIYPNVDFQKEKIKFLINNGNIYYPYDFFDLDKDIIELLMKNERFSHKDVITSLIVNYDYNSRDDKNFSRINYIKKHIDKLDVEMLYSRIEHILKTTNSSSKERELSEIRDFIRPYKAEFEKKVLLETMKKDNLIESKVKNRL